MKVKEEHTLSMDEPIRLDKIEEAIAAIRNGATNDDLAIGLEQDRVKKVGSRYIEYGDPVQVEAAVELAIGQQAGHGEIAANIGNHNAAANDRVVC